MTYKTRILMTEFVTHDVKRFILQKPKGFKFIPGQATLMSINTKGWQDQKRPFTFTSLNDDKVLEFTIKGYFDHKGVTQKLHSLKPGATLTIEDPQGTINYKGTGVFIAGGAGITPFIAIFRQLKKDNQLKGNSLIFTNKTSKDIILEKEFNEIFDPGNVIYILTKESKQGYLNSYVNKEFLQEKVKNFSQHFYICGPKPFMADIKQALLELGASVDQVVFEK